MIAIIICLTVAFIAANVALAIAVRTIKTSRAVYTRDIEIAARLARVQARDEFIQAHVPLVRKY